MRGSVGKQIQKACDFLPPCGNRCRFSESAICSSRVHPPSKIKSNLKFKALRWRLPRWRLTLSDLADVLYPQNRNKGTTKKKMLAPMVWYFLERHQQRAHCYSEPENTSTTILGCVTLQVMCQQNAKISVQGVVFGGAPIVRSGNGLRLLHSPLPCCPWLPIQLQLLGGGFSEDLIHVVIKQPANCHQSILESQPNFYQNDVAK